MKSYKSIFCPLVLASFLISCSSTPNNSTPYYYEATYLSYTDYNADSLRMNIRLAVRMDSNQQGALSRLEMSDFPLYHYDGRKKLNQTVSIWQYRDSSILHPSKDTLLYSTAWNFVDGRFYELFYFTPLQPNWEAYWPDSLYTKSVELEGNKRIYTYSTQWDSVTTTTNQWTVVNNQPVSFISQTETNGSISTDEIRFKRVLNQSKTGDEWLEAALPEFPLLDADNRTSNNQNVTEEANSIAIGDAIALELVNSSGDEFVNFPKDDAPIILDFWFMGCPPCLKSIPKIQAYLDKHLPAYANNYLLVNTKEEAGNPKVLSWVEKQGLTADQLFYVDDAVAELEWGVYSYPTLWMIKGGELVAIESGYSEDILDEIHAFFSLP